jgi:GGDEF domain-containing protein
VRRLVKDIKAAVSEIVLDDKIVTISVGTAAYSGKDMPMEQLFELADKALYIDKFGAKEELGAE